MTDPEPDTRDRPGPGPVATLLRLVMIIAVIVGINLTIGDLLRDWEMEFRPESIEAMRWGLLVTCLVYALILALPFVPGVEIGIALLAMLGPIVALHVYLATVAGLSLSFLVGRLVPLSALVGAARLLRMRRTAEMIEGVRGLPPSQRAALHIARSQSRWVPFLLRHRHIALAILLNLPGNAMIGGGGGIALAAGFSRVFSIPAFVVVVAVAVAPVPLAVYLFGSSALQLAP